MRIGGHFHVDNPLAEATARGADAVQFFLGDPQGWKGPVIPGGDPEAVQSGSHHDQVILQHTVALGKWRQKDPRSGLLVFVHTSRGPERCQPAREP